MVSVGIKEADGSAGQSVEYKFVKNSQMTKDKVPKSRVTLIVYLILFQAAFIILFGLFGHYESDLSKTTDDVPRLYSMYINVHTMMFVGFGFLMTFLKRYGFGSISFNFLLTAYVIEWALLVKGWIETGGHGFTISVINLLEADFCSAAILISFGAVLGKTSLTQLVVMTTFEVVIQNLNEYIGVELFGGYDVGESIYVHVFGAYFGLAVAKVLHNKEVETSKEGSIYHSDLFSMIGTLFLWIYWPSFNSAVAVDEGQTRAIVNTVLSIASSTITTFIVSTLTSKKRLNMIHIQNATLAGGVAVGAVANMVVQPFGAMIIGSSAGIISVIGFDYIMPALKKIHLHDTCGVHNLHGLPGVFSGLASIVVASYATPDLYGGEDRLYVFYPARGPAPLQPHESHGGLPINPNMHNRTAKEQALYQLIVLGITLGIAIVGGILTGLVMKLPIFEPINDEDKLYDDDSAFITPDDYALELTEVKVTSRQIEYLNQQQQQQAGFYNFAKF